MEIRVRQRSTTMKRTVNVLSKLNWGTRACAVLALCATTAIALPAQTLTTLYSFDGTDGQEPVGALVQATNGDLYGTTERGGSGINNGGTVFRITPGGTLTTLYSFCPQTNCTDGFGPKAGLVQAANGDLYGTTWGGGVNSQGTVFKITQSGTLTTLYSFCSQTICTDGEVPFAGLVQPANWDLYGTTRNGPANGQGTVFKIPPGGTLTTLYNFCSQTNCTDGRNPYAGLVQAANGDFYGTTFYGGANNNGTIFKITPTGRLTTLHSFCSQTNCTDGAAPDAGLVQDTNGDFYGTTAHGSNNHGTVFRLSVGLGPFVKPRPPFGKVGAAVKILGTDLTGATSVGFNGTAAVFEVVSSSEITTTVPSGASS